MSFGKLQPELPKVEIIKQAGLMDQRRQAQIQNQIASINRLLDDPSATAEIVVLHERLAAKQDQLNQIQQVWDDQKFEPRNGENPDAAILFRALKEIMEVVHREEG